MLQKLVAHCAEVLRPLESAAGSCYVFLGGCYTDLPRTISLLKLHMHTHTHIYIYKYMRIFRGGVPLLDTKFAQFAVI